MLAKLHDKAFDDKDWVYEIKWDGYRAIAEINGSRSRLYSRNGLSFEHKYPLIFEQLGTIKQKMIIDGEITALNPKGLPSFQLLQQYETDQTVPLVYYVFDILKAGNRSLEKETLVERKKILEELLPQNDVIRYCDHIEEKGIAFFKQVKKQGLEGMIAKKADSLYYEGTRSSDWLKVKNVLTDEAVIVGYTRPRNSRKYFGALILGVYKKNKLVYIGHTGTGFTDKTLKAVYNKLQPLVVKTSPFDTQVKVNAPVTWVKPKLVCNLKFTEVTADGSRRHPVFMGLRDDKIAKEVHAEAGIEVQ
ncbi:MAG: non-homologous end-joining DNA ligase [Chitinophagaceae bacterium]